MRKKNNSKTMKQVVAPVETKKEEVKTPVASELKTDVKNEVEKAVEKTTEKVEKAVEKTTEKVAEKAAEVKADIKETVKKTTVKATKKEPVKPEIIVQYQNSEVDTAAIEERVKAQFVAEGHKAGFIRKLSIYIKPEEYSAYYVINDKFSGRVDLF